MHNYTIETTRLLLRPLTIDDAQDVFEWVSDEQVARYMVYPTYKNIEQVYAWLTSIQDSVERHREYHFGYVRKQDGKLIGSGSIGPDSEREDFWGFGYNFRRDCWGMGYATEAARAMLQFAHDTLGADKFSSSHVDVNRASGRVMEKCGLHFEKYLTDSLKYIYGNIEQSLLFLHDRQIVIGSHSESFKNLIEHLTVLTCYAD